MCAQDPQHFAGYFMSYRCTRNAYENLEKQIFDGVGPFDIPELRPVKSIPDVPFVGFNYAKTHKDPEHSGVHFFIDDYQFMRLWNRPDQYLDLIGSFACVCTPDFSTYRDHPKIIQLYNHYRKHWLGAYWQLRGITVIPTISWSDEASFEWCFDGEPRGGIVAVSSVGALMGGTTQELFMWGYEEMLARLDPCAVLFYGRVPEACKVVKIIHIESFQTGLRQRTDAR